MPHTTGRNASLPRFARVCTPTLPRLGGLCAATLLALGALAGCSPSTPTTDDEGEQSQSQPQSVTPPQSADPGDQSGGDSDSEALPDEDAAAGVDTSTWALTSSAEPTTTGEDGVIVTGLRVAAHEGFERVVVDLGGPGAGWQARYVDTPTGQGKGDPIEIAGNAFLQVDVTGVSIPVTDADYAAYYEGGQQVSGNSVHAIYESTFEGRAQFIIGVDSVEPFYIFALDNPSRIVIDIATK